MKGLQTCLLYLPLSGEISKSQKVQITMRSSDLKLPGAMMRQMN
jgi:hypothetical protein